MGVPSNIYCPRNATHADSAASVSNPGRATSPTRHTSLLGIVCFDEQVVLRRRSRGATQERRAGDRFKFLIAACSWPEDFLRPTERTETCD
jgi:hypothetical protein